MIAQPSHATANILEVLSSPGHAPIRRPVTAAARVPPFSVRALRKGEHLCRVGGRMNSLYRVRAGILKCYRVNEDGDEQVLGFHLADDICGFDGMGGQTASCNVVALDSTSLDVIPASIMIDDNTANIELRRSLLAAMSREIQRLVGMLQLERCTAEQRVAIFLLQHSAYERRRGCFPHDFVLPMSRRDLARYLHLATETVSRILSRLQATRVLRVERNHVVIIDRRVLKMLSDNTECDDRMTA